MADKVASQANEYQLIGPSENGDVSDLLTGLESKDARQRVQALIAQWLRMENLVVLAGAGTSVSSDGKTMPNLERDVLAAVKSASGLPVPIGAVIDARMSRATSGGAAPATGFEDWLSFLTNARYIASAPGSPFADVKWRGSSVPTQDDLAWFVDKVSKAIFMECSLILPDIEKSDAREIAPHLAFLAKLVGRDSNLGRAHLFTLNYDTLFEQALELLGVQYFDGFTGRADARFDPAVYGLDIYYPGEVAEGRVRRFDKFLHLYKLHGSIHWQVRGEEVRARHPDLSDLAKYHTLSPADKAPQLEKLADGMPPVAILPTANKFAQTLTMPFAHLFRAFQIRLSAPQTFLLVLGYGFGDAHVNHIIETALMNPSLIMLVVEPDSAGSTVKRINRYKDLGKRAFVLTSTKSAFASKKFKIATFDDFARSVMPDVQWLDDFLRLRRFEKEIQTSSGPSKSRSEGPSA